MNDDPRCCGTGTCIINNEGYCWCGQRWDGEKMCFDSEITDQTASTCAANNGLTINHTDNDCTEV